MMSCGVISACACLHIFWHDIIDICIIWEDGSSRCQTYHWFLACYLLVCGIFKDIRALFTTWGSAVESEKLFLSILNAKLGATWSARCIHFWTSFTNRFISTYSILTSKMLFTCLFLSSRSIHSNNARRRLSMPMNTSLFFCRTRFSCLLLFSTFHQQHQSIICINCIYPQSTWLLCLLLLLICRAIHILHALLL